MNTRSFGLFARHLAAAGAFALAALGAAAPSAWAQGIATLSGTTSNSCTYTSITTLPNGNVTVTCVGGSPTTASLTIAHFLGSLATTSNSSATVRVNCTGACDGVAVSLAVTPPIAGVTLPTPAHTFGPTGGFQNFTVNGAATPTEPLAAGSATIAMSVTAAGDGVTTTPAVGGSAITASVPIVDAEAPGTLSFASAAATVVEGASPFTVNITRTGAGSAAPAASVAYTCTTIPPEYTPGITPASGSTLIWPTGNTVTTQSFTINPTTVPDTAAGTVTCTLGTPTVGGLGANPTFTLTVNKASTGGTCTTTATVNADLSTSSTNTRAAGPSTPMSMGGLNTAAVKVSATRVYVGGTSKTLNQVSFTAAPGATAPSALQWNVSECPGDFTTVMGPSCGPTYTTRVTTLRFATTPTSGSCRIDPSKNYYINLRWVNPSTGATTCTASTCGMYVDVNY